MGEEREALMRLMLALALVGAVQAQEGPGRTGTSDVLYTISCSQGWKFKVAGERDLLTTDVKDLTRGLTPRYIPLMTDPLKVEGTVILNTGQARYDFSRIEYWDAGQRWWIEFAPRKVRTFELGGVAKWNGTPEEWIERLAGLERSFFEAYLKVTTPQRPEASKPVLGLVPQGGGEAGRRLFVTSALEEQLQALLLARLNGALPETAWPALVETYPPRVVTLAKAFLGRVEAQCAGELRPREAGRTSGARQVQNLSWDGSGSLVPHFAWPDGAAWAREEVAPFEEARRRMERLAEGSWSNGGLQPGEFDAAAAREREELRRRATIAPTAVAPTPADALTPKRIAQGKATFDYHEERSTVEIQGTLKDAEVVYFHSGLNRWRVGRMDVHTWYKGSVRKK
jgi:hypothetical protein